jgi:hypothetical protein
MLYFAAAAPPVGSGGKRSPVHTLLKPDAFKSMAAAGTDLYFGYAKRCTAWRQIDTAGMAILAFRPILKNI